MRFLGEQKLTQSQWKRKGLRQSESESEISEFVRENWKKFGLWEYYFEFGAVGGDAVAVENGQMVGIEFETRPGRYIEHRHDINPDYTRVKYLLCNRSNGVSRECFRQTLIILTKDDLERLVASNAPMVGIDIYKNAKRLVESAVAEYLKRLYGLVDCMVTLPP